MARLLKLPQVQQVHLLPGEWDIMATLAFKEEIVDPREHLVDIVSGKIRKMSLVERTNTIVPAMSMMKETHVARPERRAYAFVFIQTKMGKELEVLNRIMKYDEVFESHLVLGRSDVLAVLEFEKGLTPPVPERIANILTGEIAKISDIVDTETISPLRSIVKSDEPRGSIRTGLS